MDALIVINEKAGSLSAQTIQKSIEEELLHYPPRIRAQVQMLIAPDAEELETVIRNREAELDRVIAVGGDGTVTRIISAILPYPHLQLGIIPMGTGNRLATNLGIPLHLKDALHVALTGHPYRIDVGRINGQYFSLMAGAGLDAAIMAEVQPFEKRTMGIFAYIWRGIHQAFQVPYTVFEIEADGRLVRTRGVGVVVANAGNLLGRFFTLTPGAEPDDGLFDICILASKSRTDYWTSIVQILSQQRSHVGKGAVQHLRARRIVIRSKPKVRVQADGDVIGMTPLEIEALPGAVAVLVSPHKKPSNPITDSIHQMSDHLRLVIRDILRI